MSSKHSTRNNMRRKMVLPVTVIRKSGQERQLAHTLDMTEQSARLGGLSVLLEPGEIIEIQRGAVKTRFQVFWMGAPGSAMEGQAGVRATEPGRNIWGIAMPPDEIDVSSPGAVLRKPTAPIKTIAQASDKRWHTRFECNGAASVRPADSDETSFGQVKDISLGGVYVETPAPLPVNTLVHVKMKLEGLAVESPGVVRTIYPQVGMGISFQRMLPENQDRIGDVIETLRRRMTYPKKEREVEVTPQSEQDLANRKQLGSDTPVKEIATACQSLVEDFDMWKETRTEEEIEELRHALVELQQKLNPPSPVQHHQHV
jgi:PilZ domain-containing protein